MTFLNAVNQTMIRSERWRWGVACYFPTHLCNLYISTNEESIILNKEQTVKNIGNRRARLLEFTPSTFCHTSSAGQLLHPGRGRHHRCQIAQLPALYSCLWLQRRMTRDRITLHTPRHPHTLYRICKHPQPRMQKYQIFFPSREVPGQTMAQGYFWMRGQSWHTCHF